MRLTILPPWRCRLVKCIPQIGNYTVVSVGCFNGSLATRRPSRCRQYSFALPITTVKVPRQRMVPRATDSAGESREVVGFTALGLGPELLSGLTELSVSTPTPIQAKAIPEIMQKKDVLLASHTGSGKTLAYLLPIIRMLRQEEAEEGLASRLKRPRALILGPTRELTDQF
eukprot:jgi/Botrbrau1/11161/Bobra.182_2s0016.1